MKQPEEVLKVFEKYRNPVDEEIKRLLGGQSSFVMYDMMRYFFGYLDEDLKPAEAYGGKRFRAGICLMLADMYGAVNKAIEAATAIEIFHQFTLVHDDIMDNDETRRGRSTVWKKWGISHAILVGDGQFNLVGQELIDLSKKNPKVGVAVHDFLNQKFLEVIEGQSLDLSMVDLSIADDKISETSYLEMITKKTSVLVGAASKTAGMIAGVSKEEQEALWQYGLNLGLAFQLRDDMLEIWASEEETGKAALGDLVEKKKILSVLYLYNQLDEAGQKELSGLYDQKEELSQDEAKRVKEMLDGVNAYDYAWQQVIDYRKKSEEAIAQLSTSDEQKKVLLDVNAALLSEIKAN